jgi:hypothetical protein
VKFVPPYFFNEASCFNVTIEWTPLDATTVNAFYFVGYSQPLNWCFLSQMQKST